MSGKTYHRILSAVVCVSLLLNSLWGVFLYPQTVFAEESSESAELEQVEETAPTPTPSPTLSPDPNNEEPTIDSLTEDLEEPQTSDESAALVPSVWVENEDGSVTTSESVGEGIEYRYKNTQVKVVFTKLTTPGYLTIREFEPENAEELGIVGKAYEITSDMQNGTFLYDLTLPIPEEAGDDFEIKYAENGDSLDNAQVVEEFKEENENTVTIRGLDHFTVFIITDDEASYTGGLWIDYATQGYQNGGVHYPAAVPAGQTATWTFSTITPGTYSVFISWSTDPNRTTTAPYILNYNDGSLAFSINQELLADQTTTGGSGQWSGWYLLGAYSLNTDSTLVLTSVENSSESDYVIADEIRLTQAPTIVSPANNSFLKTTGLPKIDWTDSIGTNIPFTYQYQSFSDENYTVNRWGPSSWLSNSEIPTTGTPEGVYYIRVRAKDAEDNITDWSNGADNPYKVTIDNTSPLITWDSPNNGSIHNGTINLKAICSEDCDYVNFWWRAENEEYSSVSKRYHYVYENGTEFEWNLDTLNAEKWDGSTYLMEDGAYYLYAAGKDLAGNWSRTPDLQVVVDNTAPIADLVFPAPGHSSISFQVIFSEDVIKSEAENLANYFLNNWPGAGGSGNLIGEASVVYDSFTRTATITFTNPDWYISAEQEWGVQDIHDLAGNLLNPNPTTETSTPMVNPTSPGIPITSPNPTNSTNQTWNWTMAIDPGGVSASGIKGYYSRIYDLSLNDFWSGWVSLGYVLETTTNLNEGSWKLFLKSEDNAGNQSDEISSSELVVDTTAPLVTIESPSDFSLLRGTVSVLGTLIEDIELSHYNFSIYSGDADFNDFSQRLYSDTQYTSLGFTNEILYEWDTTTWDDGDYLLRFAARDKAGNRNISGDPYLGGDDSQHVVRVTVDNTKPNSVIEDPSSPDYFNEPIMISGQTTDFIGVDEVTLSYTTYDPDTDTCGTIYTSIETIDNVLDNSPFNWSLSIPWTPPDEGNYCIKASGKDLVGNIEDSAIVKNVVYDITNPEIAWTKPAKDTIISGTTVILSVATDNLSGVDSVTYYYQRDGEVGYKIIIKTSSPYEASWDTTGLALDNYNLKAVATDKAGNSVEAAIRSVSVAAVISGETWSRPEFGKITVSWTTDRPTSGRVVYDTTSHPIDPDHPNYGYANTSGVVDSSPKTTSHTVTLSELLNGITYYWRTVSTGSPIVISKEHRGDTFSIPSPGDGGGGAVAGLTTDTTTTPFVTGEIGEISVSEEEEVLGEETTTITSPEELEGVGESVLGKSKVIRVILWGGAALGGLILIYFFFRRRKRR